VYVLIRDHFALFDLAADAWRVWAGALIAYDFCYYWNHRVDHEVGIFWAAHVVHHQSDRFHRSTAIVAAEHRRAAWLDFLPAARDRERAAGRVRRGRPHRFPLPVLDSYRACRQARLVRLCLRLALEPPHAPRD